MIFPDQEIPESFKWKYKPKDHTSTFKPLTRRNSKKRSFIVADIETLMKDGVQIPFAIGYLVVHPGDDLSKREKTIHTFFSEDYCLVSKHFEDRSLLIISNFIKFLKDEKRKSKKIRTVYFHNLGRFNGVFLLKWFYT